MHAADFVGAVEIGERARDAQHAMLAAGGQLHGGGGVAQQREPRSVGAGDLFQHRPLRLRIGAHMG